MFALGISVTGVSCRTISKDASQSKSTQDILDIQRIGSDYLVTCLDGSTQKIPVSSFAEVTDTDVCGQVLTSECSHSSNGL